MKIRNTKLISAAAVALTLCACGEADKAADKIILEADTDEYANITIVNTLDRSVSVHMKSEIYNRDVYNGDFRELEVMAERVSLDHKYEWIEDYEKTEFGIKDAVTGELRAKSELSLEDENDYWMIAWQYGNTRTVSVFEREKTAEAGTYKVRIFADGAYKIEKENVELASTIPGEVSGGYTVDNCDDLSIGETTIDMCTIATAGQSYLITYTQNGYFIGKE